MHPLAQPAQPPDPLIWPLIIAMIMASPQRPWMWAVLVSVGTALSLWHRR
ncbi:hypothetical protein ACWF94_00695 [Streptomyces sp. NPDC055078]